MGWPSIGSVLEGSADGRLVVGNDVGSGVADSFGPVVGACVAFTVDSAVGGEVGTPEGRREGSSVIRLTGMEVGSLEGVF